MVKWIRSHKTTIWWMSGASILIFIAALIVVPLLAARIPSDYFAHRRRQRKRAAHQHPVVRGGLLIGKNLLGYVLIAAGIIMLALPGPGVLTTLVGIMLLNFPGKYRLERWMVTRPPVLRSINKLRQRAGRPPLFLKGNSDRRS